MVVTSKVSSITGCCQSGGSRRLISDRTGKGRVIISMKNPFGIATALLILCIAFCARGTVMSKENPDRVRENERYAVWEQKIGRAHV